jgi:hypothetical protein
VSRAHSAAKAYDFSVAEAAQAQPLTGDCQGIDTPAAHACDALRLEEAVHGLALRSPEFSASSGLWEWQKSILSSLAIIFCAGTLCRRKRALLPCSSCWQSRSYSWWRCGPLPCGIF